MESRCSGNGTAGEGLIVQAWAPSFFSGTQVKAKYAKYLFYYQWKKRDKRISGVHPDFSG